MLLLLLVSSMLPVLLAVNVAGDLAAGFTISLRYRALGLLRGARVLRRPRPPAPPAPATTPAAADGATTTGVAHRSGPPAAAEGTGHAAGARSRLYLVAERVRLAQRLLRSGAVRIARPRGWLEFALADPGETGRAFGFACALATLADPDGTVELRPLWTTADWLGADLALDARVIPLRVALVAAHEWLTRRRGKGTQPSALERSTDAA